MKPVTADAMQRRIHSGNDDVIGVKEIRLQPARVVIVEEPPHIILGNTPLAAKCALGGLQLAVAYPHPSR